MKLKHLPVIMIAAVSAVATAQTAKPNPFARPSAAAVAAAASASASTAPGAAPSMPNGVLPSMPMGMQPGMNGIPGMPGMPGMPGATDPNTITEDVTASRVGTINGLRIFRGSSTYMFEDVKKRKLVRNLIPENPASAAAATGAKPANLAGVHPNTTGTLPSMVGKPATKN